MLPICTTATRMPSRKSFAGTSGWCIPLRYGLLTPIILLGGGTSRLWRISSAGITAAAGHSPGRMALSGHSPDGHRCSKAREAPSGPWKCQTIAAEMKTLDDSNDWHEIAPLLDSALDALPEKDRAVVLLRYFQNKPLAEIAAAMSSTDNAVQKRLLEPSNGSAAYWPNAA